MTPVQITATAISTAILVLSAMAKITKAGKIAEEFGKMNLLPHLMWISMMELVIAALYAIPLTMNYGFFLVCSYFGGAMAAHITAKEWPVRPLIILVIMWVCMFFRSPVLFYLK